MCFLICSSYRAELTHTYLIRKSMLFNAIGYIGYSLTIKESLHWLLQMLICTTKACVDLIRESHLRQQQLHQGICLTM